MRMPAQENASTQIAARILADVKGFLSAENASKAAARAQAESSSIPASTITFQGSLGRQHPQVPPDHGCMLSLNSTTVPPKILAERICMSIGKYIIISERFQDLL